MVRVKELVELWRRDNLMKQALAESHTMLERTGVMFRESVKSLRQADAGEIGIDIYEEDRKVNHFERDVRRKILKHLVITGELNVVAGLILSSIVIDIERIGDYMKNIMELAAAHPAKLTCGKYEGDVQRIEATVSRLFEAIVPTLQASDTDRARRLIDESLWIKKKCDEIDADLIGDGDPSLSSGDAVAIALYVRYLKRIGAHLMNVLSSVVNPFDRIGFREGGDDLV